MLPCHFKSDGWLSLFGLFHKMAGAYDKETRIFVLPGKASKDNQYICPDPGCGKDVVLCKGKVVKPYFRHNRIDSCVYFSHPGESQIHIQAKLLLKHVLEASDVKWNRTCSTCGTKDEYLLPRLEGDKVELEKRFQYKNRDKIADVAIITQGNQHIPAFDLDKSYMLFIIEICHTHSTDEMDRPEPWLEVKAKTIVETPIDKLFPLQCIRTYQCDGCILKRAKQLSDGFIHSNNKVAYFRKHLMDKEILELFVRYRLQQNDFTSFIMENGYVCSRISKHNVYPGNTKDHLRIEYHYDENDGDNCGNCPNNNKIIALFDDIWKACNYRIYTYAWKGGMYTLILDRDDNRIINVNHPNWHNEGFLLELNSGTCYDLCKLIKYCME